MHLDLPPAAGLEVASAKGIEQVSVAEDVAPKLVGGQARRPGRRRRRAFCGAALPAVLVPMGLDLCPVTSVEVTIAEGIAHVSIKEDVAPQVVHG